MDHATGAGSTSIFSAVLLTCLLALAPAALPNCKTKPRIVSSRCGSERLSFDKVENVTVMYHEPGSSIVLVGAEDVLYLFDFKDKKKTTVNFSASNQASCVNEPSEFCKNFLTVIQKWKENLLVCGTNAYNPTCWNWINGSKVNMIDGRGFSPFVPDTNFLILFSDNNVYSTIGKALRNGQIPRFRRIQGREPFQYTGNDLMKNPHYVTIKLVTQEENYKDKIYFFFREDNLEENMDTDITVSRVAQICKEDRGANGAQGSAMWSTFLKARLVCGYPEKGQFYSRLHDIFFVRCEKTYETKVYGVFSSPWNESAVCVYTMAEIEHVFQTSPLKGNPDLRNLKSRPGECVVGGNKTSDETFKVAIGHPETAKGVEPIGNKPLFHCHAHYRRIVVDQVTAVDGTSHNVLFLSTVDGAIDKFLEVNRSVTNLLKLQPFNTTTTIHSMELDSKTKRLYVSTSQEVVEVPVDWCGWYTQTCQSCLMSKDPYCVWANGTCTSSRVTRPTRDTHKRTVDLCQEEPKAERLQNPKLFTSEDYPPKSVVKRSSTHMLSCPVDSHHATYTWLQDENIPHDCLLNSASDECILLLRDMKDSDYGLYQCVAKESGTTRIMTELKLVSDHGTFAVASIWVIATQIAACLLLLQ